MYTLFCIAARAMSFVLLADAELQTTPLYSVRLRQAERQYGHEAAFTDKGCGNLLDKISY